MLTAEIAMAMAIASNSQRFRWAISPLSFSPVAVCAIIVLASDSVHITVGPSAAIPAGPM